MCSHLLLEVDSDPDLWQVIIDVRLDQRVQRMLSSDSASSFVVWTTCFPLHEAEKLMSSHMLIALGLSFQRHREISIINKAKLYPEITDPSFWKSDVLCNSGDLEGNVPQVVRQSLPGARCLLWNSSSPLHNIWVIFTLIYSTHEHAWNTTHHPWLSGWNSEQNRSKSPSMWNLQSIWWRGIVNHK